jgi:hypothetical protein
MSIKKFLVGYLLCLTSLTHASIFADTSIIRSHLTALTKTKSFRTHANVTQLNQTAGYIQTVFAKYSDKVSIQEYKVKGQSYRNIIASFGTSNSTRIIIGAHYDVCGQQQGADDNASGVTGLLELARMLKGQVLKYRIDLVAFTLEEPPYFRTQSMGSYVHAKSLADAKASVYGMISLEMIGYFSDHRYSQSYPDGVPPETFGDKGDYIALVTKSDARNFEQKFCTSFKSTNIIKTNLYSGPPSMPGIDFSDHMNYWKFNFSALMIRDTSFYRNKNYHSATDTMETLDLRRMAKVIDGIYKTLGLL